MKSLKLIVFSVFIIYFHSCHENSKINRNKVKGDKFLCGNYYCKGKTVESVYEFCSITPTSVQYQYKKGDWKFWDLQGNLIAEGIYDIGKEMTIGGGCPTEVNISKINPEKWKFYDTGGNHIKASAELIETLEIVKAN